MQLSAHGRAVPDDFAIKNNVAAVSASDIPLAPNKILPHPLTHEEIKTYVEAFAHAAINAIHKVGFDAVELHFANGYLPDQFLQDVTNHRTDEYGGTTEKRTRFPLEIIDAVTKAVGEDKVAFRLSPWSPWQGSLSQDVAFVYSPSHFYRYAYEGPRSNVQLLGL
jgi:NADPH2 dehydrogenase